MSDVNVFILVNLGCEMLYVIDQRLRAQNISLDKSIQVMKDVTGVLLDPTFIERLIIGSRQKAILTEDHCKFILKDLACCSLMRLDESSMSKLWDLITMVFKWQIEVASEMREVLDITFRHLDGIGHLYPNAKKTMLIDCAKATIGSFWDEHNSDEQKQIFDSIKNWLKPFTTKISIFIRLGFQSMEGNFYKDLNTEQFKQFAKNTGENIYAKNDANRNKKSSSKESGVEFNGLAEQLNIAPVKDNEVCPITATLYFHDAIQSEDDKSVAGSERRGEFIQLKPVRTTSSSWQSLIGTNPAQISKKSLETLLNSNLSPNRSNHDN